MPKENRCDLAYFYHRMNEFHIKNRKDSQYWIYNIATRIIKQDDVNKRYLRIQFFNRRMNENNNLMRLYFKVNGEEKYMDLFKMVSRYKDANILYTIIEIDLAQEDFDVEITGYIKDGKRVTLSGDYIPRFHIENDDLKLAAIKEKFFKGNEDQCHNIPYIDDDFWICSCGYYLDSKQKICPNCQMEKSVIEQISCFKVEDLLEDINEKIPVDVEGSVDDLIVDYSLYMNEKFGISEADTIEKIDRDILLARQNKLVNETIDEIIEDNPIKFNRKLSFEDNLKEYATDNAYGMISEKAILERIDKDEWQKEYDDFIEKDQSFSAKIKKYGIIIAIIVAFIIVVTVGYFIISGFFNNSKQSVSDEVVTEEVVFMLNQYDYTIKVHRFGDIDVSTTENVSFVSQDLSIVKVDEGGKMYGVSAGDTTITVSDLSASKDYTIKVTVEGDAITSSDDEVTDDADTPDDNITVDETTSDDYILEKSDSELLGEDDIAGLSKSQLRLARNEIYARHGCYFDDEDLQSYFEGCSWYENKNIKASEYDSLSDIEKQNVDFIKSHE